VSVLVVGNERAEAGIRRSHAQGVRARSACRGLDGRRGRRQGPRPSQRASAREPFATRRRGSRPQLHGCQPRRGGLRSGSVRSAGRAEFGPGARRCVAHSGPSARALWPAAREPAIATVVSAGVAERFARRGGLSSQLLATRNDEGTRAMGCCRDDPAPGRLAAALGARRGGWGKPFCLKVGPPASRRPATGRIGHSGAWVVGSVGVLGAAAATTAHRSR